MQSYLDLVGAAPAATKDHELFVCLQIDAKRAWRQIKRGRQERRRRGRLRSPPPRARGTRGAACRCRRPRRRSATPRDARERDSHSLQSWSRPGLAHLAAIDRDRDRDGIDEGAAWPVASVVTEVARAAEQLLE